ncbi:MAG: hypothetical protein P4L41_18415, partial [Flavipsychrobacter sp.]|nr:hypothetical protein [Flavipsychrobacter sp.]
LGAGTIGNYTVKVTSNVGCAATTPTPTTIHVFAIPPTNVIPSSSTTFCSGSGNSVTLNAGTGSGLTYQWQSVSGGSLTNIPGATSASYVDSVGGNFRVVVSNSYCAVASIVIPVTVNTPPPVSISAAGATTICDGSSVTLNASATGVGYQWKLNGSPLSPNGTSSSYTATRGGSYTVVVNSGNCIAASPAVVVKVNALPKDTVVLTPLNTPPLYLTKNNNPTCAGNPAYLTDKNGAAGFSYQWKLNGGNIPVNANGMNYGALDSGLYSFTVTDTNGCVGTSPSMIGTTPAYYVGLHALPDPTVIVSGSTLTTGTFAGYQWQLNGTDIPGATSNGYTATQSGSYKVRVTDGFGCTQTSDASYVFGVGVSTVNKSDIKIFPNPVTSIVHIESPVKVNV